MSLRLTDEELALLIEAAYLYAPNEDDKSPERFRWECATLEAAHAKLVAERRKRDARVQTKTRPR